MSNYVFNTAETIWRTGDMEIFHCYDLRQNEDVLCKLPDELADGLNEKVLISQTTSEAIVLMSEMLQKIYLGDNRWGDISWDENKYKIFLELTIDKPWRENEKVHKNLGSIKAVMYGDCMQIGAYDLTRRFIPSKLEYPNQYSKYTIAVCMLIAYDIVTDEEFGEMFKEYSLKPNRDDFFRIYMKLKKKHWFVGYELVYDAVSYMPFKDCESLLKQYSAGPETKEKSKNDKAAAKEFKKKDFNKEFIDLIPNIGDEFLFPEQLENLSDAIAEGDIKSILLHGPAGTGKTMACKLISKRVKMPLMDVINCTENLDEYVLGKYIPEGDQIVFKESFVTKAIREGGAVVFEEINFAKPQYLSFLNSLLDDNGFVRLDNGEVVKRHPNFRFMATMNVGYFGTKELNQALYNRFQAVVEIKELSDEAIRQMLMKRIPECGEMIEYAILLYHQIKDKIKREELDVVISPRNIENWMRLCKYEAVETAAEKTIVPIAKGDRELETDLRLLIKQCVRR